MPILALLLTLLLQATPLAASELDIVELRNRPAEEIIPLIQPMLNADESISGRGFQLILKADAARQPQIRELIGKLDRAPAQLMISVFQGSERDVRALGIDAELNYRNNDTRVHIGSSTAPSGGTEVIIGGGDTHVSGKITSTRSRLRDNPVHRLRISEGSAGYIETGKSIPYFSGQVYRGSGRQIVESSVEYKDVTSGFYVRPRLSGDRVILDISPHRDSLNTSIGGAVNTRRAATTISGPLGEWIPLGGTTEQASQSSTSPGKRYSTQDRHSETIWIKVERIQ